MFIAVLQPEDESARQRAELLRKYVMPHKNLIYSICIKYTYNQEDIEDNYLEALANFFKYMDSYDPARPVKTWIYAVTKRLVADLNNRNRNRMPPDDNIDISEISSSLSDEDEPSGNSMGMDNYREFYNDDILWALDRLKPIYREALLLQQAGYKLGEIMEITYNNGTLQTRNVETVKSRIFLAKTQLNDSLSLNITDAGGSLHGWSAPRCGRILCSLPAASRTGNSGCVSTACAGRSSPSVRNACPTSVSARHMPFPDMIPRIAGNGTSPIHSERKPSAAISARERNAATGRTGG